ncbi:GNAT family N-acetyltransferase [Clostridium sp. MSJ-8]|uniref:GNAT family N-acetyltransferase n=1 Tax=Clostridium sp. MSJ-8 TaxID=2841510 RepID=UPI00345F4515
MEEEPKLFQYAKEEGIKRGIKKVRIEVRNDNTHAIELYKKVGLKISSKASESSVYMTMDFSDFMA